MSSLPEPARGPAVASPSRLPTLARTTLPTKDAGPENAPRRRSLLPQVGLPKTAGVPMQPAKEERAAAPSREAAGHSRGLSRTRAAISRVPGSRKVEDSTRQAMPPPPVPSGVGRTSSLRKPTTSTSSRTTGLRAPSKPGMPKPATSTQPGQSVPGRNSRPGSAASASSTSTVVRNPPSQKERLRAATMSASQTERPRPAPNASRMPAPPTTDANRTSSSSKMVKHSRSRSELTAPRTQTNLASARPVPTFEKEAKLAAKPAFSTLQQHFSPKKTLERKKSTPAFLQSSAANAVTPDALPPELLGLQTELLQLHLLHDDSSRVQAQWERSAERALRLQFYEVATAHHNMRKNESEVQELVNLCALQEWSSGGGRFGLAEKMQLLGPVLNELRALTDAGGRHRRAAQEFEQWMGMVQGVWTGREGGQMLEAAPRLGEAWRAETGVLERKATAVEREVERLMSAAPGSSIRAIVDGCRALVKGMLGELQVMRRVEQAVGEGEARYVEQELAGVAAAIERRQLEAQQGGAAWRAV